MAKKKIYKATDTSKTSRHLNQEKKKMRCLGCNQEMETDRCHRFCRTCKRRNNQNQWHLPKQHKTGLPSSQIDNMGE